MGEFIILAAFIILVVIIIPYLLNKHSIGFYSNKHILFAKDLVSFISNCTWIIMNNIDYDKDRLHITEIDKGYHNYCEVKSLNDTTFEVEISKDEISLIHTLSSLNTNFEHYFKSLNGEWDYSDDPYSMYVQDLYQQMIYAEELCYKHNHKV